LTYQDNTLPVDGTAPTSKLPVFESTTQQSTECGVLVGEALVFTISTCFGFAAGHFAQPSKPFRGTNMQTHVMLMLDYCIAMQHMFLLHIPNKNGLKNNYYSLHPKKVSLEAIPFSVFKPVVRTYGGISWVFT
jgi:hypothetical protein